MHIYYPSNLIQRNNPQAPALLLFPSLTSNQEGFTHLISYCNDLRGWTVVVLNRRGLCEKLHSPDFHVMGNDDDTHMLLQELYRIIYFRSRPIFALGISMGGNLLLNYLCKHRDSADENVVRICAAGTICSPLHPRDVKPVDPVIHIRLTRVLAKKYVEPYLEYFDKPLFEDISKKLIPEYALRKIETQFQYDKQCYLRLSQCQNMYEWMYLHFQMILGEDEFKVRQTMICASAGITEPSELIRLIHSNDDRVWSAFPEYNFDTDLQYLTVPIICIFADDDPLVQLASKSRDAITKGRDNLLCVSRAGSHAIFRNNWYDINSDSWAEGVIFDYFMERQ
jgi:predicted alpha/beta-fold hydrolase